MPIERHRHFHLQVRNAGLRRLQILTRGFTVAMAALTAVFAGLAAASVGGRKYAGAQTRVSTPAPRPARTNRTPAPPSLPPLPDSSQLQASSPSAPAPTSPAQAPAPTPEPPVVISGGS